MKKIRIIILLVLSILILSACSKNDNDINPNLNLKEEVKLRIVGGDETYKAIDVVGKDFNKKYPNCTVIYESLQDYTKNLTIRLEQNSSTIDIFLENKIEIGSSLEKYAYDLYDDRDILDLSEAHAGLVENYVAKGADGTKKLYTLPLFAEVRGIVVNKTLLNQYNLSIPKNFNELMQVCAKIKENNKVCFLAGPGDFSQQLVYPYICNLICNSSNYQETYNMVDKAEAATAEFIKKPFEVIYQIMENRYFDYTGTRTYFNDDKIDGSSTFKAKAYLNLRKNEDGTYTKLDDIGCVAFMTCTLSQMYEIDSLKEAYGSKIDYEFILAPVGEEGGYAYLSPGKGIVINKNSENIDWSLEFLDFIFKKENNKNFAKNSNTIPNTKDAFDYMVDKFDIPTNRMSQVGDATFSYNFYKVINPTLQIICKGNNPDPEKGYMNFDDPKNPQIFSFDYYFNKLEEALLEQYNKLNQQK